MYIEAHKARDDSQNSKEVEMRSKKEIESSIEEQWKEIPKAGILHDEIKARMWRNIQNATIERRRRNYRWITAACAVLLLSVGGYQSLRYITPYQQEMVATITAQQDIRLLHLPDGTRVWVNQNTEIEYPVHFAENERNIVLKGEAFFEVARDSSRPFVITSGSIKTTVLGTSFNVKAYEDKTTEVQVRTGKVKVEGEANTVFLVRGYAGIFAPESKTIRKQKIHKLEPEWKKVLIDVDGLTLAQVLEKLQPLHSFDVEYAHDALKNLTIKGALDTRQGFDEILQTVAFALEIEIRPLGNNRYHVSQ